MSCHKHIRTIILPALLLLCGGTFSGCTTVLKSTPPPATAPRPRPTSTTGRIPGTQKPYQIDGKTYYPLPSAEGYVETGTASWYGNPFHGRIGD